MLAPDGPDATVVTLHASRTTRHPVLPLGVPTARRGLATARPARYAIARLRAELEGGPPRRRRSRSSGSRPRRSPPSRRPTSQPPPPRSRSCRSRAALVGQLGGPISHTFHASDTTLSNALAITRLGALIALVGIALADRRRPPAIDPHRRRRLGGRLRRLRASRRTSCSSPARRCSSARSSS